VAPLSEAYGGEAVTKSSVFEWHERFREGRNKVEVDERRGRPRSNRTGESVGKVRDLVHSDGRSSEVWLYN
jgi:hypothetical protein